jgi:MFS family permease
MSMSQALTPQRAAETPKVESETNLWKIIAGSSAGTLIEWYDFYIFGALAITIAPVFFPGESDAVKLLSTLATFAIGFIVRPFGAIIFGYLGDKIGRKYTFMVTLLLMGIATFFIGLLPGYATIGWLAPALLIFLRLLQGLALGGEYGGAATYVAEHCPDGQRGYWTSWIQTTATLGLFVSLGVILICRRSMSAEDFNSWGWRIPFLLSMVLVVATYFIRRKMHESPLFQRMKASGKGAKNPLVESFANKANLKLVILALLGATAGQGVIWYTGQFYAMNFIKTSLGVDAFQTEEIVSVALVIGTPFFIVFGALSDKIGRKGIMVVGCLLAVVCYLPIYQAKMGVKSQYDGEVTKLVAAPELVSTSVAEKPASADGKLPARTVTVTTTKEVYKDETIRTVVKTSTLAAGATEPKVEQKATLKFSGFTAPTAMKLTFLVWVQVLFVTMVYGPIAAFLVELFPTKIRYTSMSLPYHIGNGMFGGIVPVVGLWMVTKTGNPLAGVWYPMAVAILTIIVAIFFLRERKNVRILDEH